MTKAELITQAIHANQGTYLYRDYQDLATKFETSVIYVRRMAKIIRDELNSSRKPDAPDLNPAQVVTMHSLRDELVRELKSGAYNAPFILPKNYSSTRENSCMLMVNIFDLHLGKLAWHEESENYDYKIAKDRFIKGIHDIIENCSAYKIDQICFAVGNDFFNSDTSFPYPATTSGTPQSDDIRWQQLWREGRKIIIQAINTFNEIAPVHVPVIGGNHDFARIFYLGDLLDVVYTDNKHVEVDNSPRTRKYFKYGRNLAGFTHGNEEKMADLPLLMAQEQPILWSETDYRDWFLGHLHTAKSTSYKSTEEFKGVNIRHMRSMSGADAWHQKKGYTGNIGGCDGYIYSKSDGLVGQVMYNIKKG